MPKQSREKIIYEKRLDSLLPQLPDYVQEYIANKRRKTYAAATLLGYTHEFIKFFTWLQQEGVIDVDTIHQIPYTTLESLRKDTVEYYIEFLQNEDIRTESERKKDPENAQMKIRSKSAVDRNINALKSLFKYLTQETEDEEGECYFYRNVFSKITTNKAKETANRRAKKINASILNGDEIREFIDFLKHEYQETLDGRKKQDFIKRKERDVAIISLLLGTGIRVSEVATITLEDIDFKEMQVDIIRKGDKDDTVDILPSSLKDLEEYLRVRKEKFHVPDGEQYVFVTKYQGKHRPISVRTIQNMVIKYTKAFKSQGMFQTGKGLSPHKLRHTFATDWIKNGGELVMLRDQLGHSDISTTSLYTNLSTEQRKEIMSEMDKSRQDKRES
ncbi:tyrosine recombinase XerS [Gracilibacillus sp. YIM 98692]|uniref:tyrosine recombinase XerS n=1 Tax=Gracilibacillus sp. YIM 98692 TaxID=2663532 RepID=UPI0013D79843|nr:tyrosine recombinase XerS [Gracilibacillus sp. YIM 98692]